MASCCRWSRRARRRLDGLLANGAPSARCRSPGLLLDPGVPVGNAFRCSSTGTRAEARLVTRTGRTGYFSDCCDSFAAAYRPARQAIVLLDYEATMLARLPVHAAKAFKVTKLLALSLRTSAAGPLSGADRVVAVLCSDSTSPSLGSVNIGRDPLHLSFVVHALSPPRLACLKLERACEIPVSSHGMPATPILTAACSAAG